MNSDKQSEYELRETNNYFDLIDGLEYHSQPITFHEFLSKPESLFIYEDSFFQIPAYIQQGANINPIEEASRQYVVQYIIDEFEHLLLGMQDYVRWSKLFKNRCDAITASFWAQVNMHDLMFAYELEMDDNTIMRTQSGNAARVEKQTSTTNQTASTATTANTTTTQDIDNTQLTDSSNREANATLVRASDQLTDDIDYNWSDAADNVHELRSRAGDTNQHMESSTDSTSNTQSQAYNVSTSNLDDSSEENASTSNETMELTNKMFMQEKQWAINTARDLLPLTWLRQQLRPMFYLLY